MRPPPTVYWLLAAYCAGLILALAWRPGASLTGALLLGTVVWAVGWLTVVPDRASLPAWLAGRAALLGLVPVLVVAGLAVGEARLTAQSHSRLEALVGHTVTLRAVALTLPAVSGNRVQLDVRVVSTNGSALAEKALLQLELEPGAAPPTFTSLGPLVEGSSIDLPATRVEPLPTPKPGQFDYGRFLERRGEHVVLAAPFASLRIVGRRGGLSGLIDRLRLAARAHIRQGVRSPVREVLEAMILGDDGAVAPGPIDDFRRSGLLHILAVSGENVVLLCTMGSFVLTLARLRRDLRAVVLIPSVIVYVIVTGATPSIVRAGVSGVVALLAGLTSRPTDGWFLWLVPGAFMLTTSPNVLFDVSFQLSFAAVAGLLLLARPLTRALSFLPGWLAEPAAITSAASVSTAPVSMATFGQASLVAVPANIAGGFVLGPIMFLGMLSVFAGFVWSALSVPLNVVAGLFTGFLLTVAAWFGDLSFAVYEWHGPTLGFLVVVGLGAEAVVVALLAHRAGGGIGAFLDGRRRRNRLALAALALVAVALAVAPAPPAPPACPTLTILSVGEGAAALLQEPNGPTVLIDAGPNPLLDCLRRHGVRRIDLVVLSHGHADHTAGLADVLGHIHVGLALVPRPVTPSAALTHVVAELTAAGVPVRPCVTEQTIDLPGGRLTVLPTGTSGAGGNQGENDCALVVEVSLEGETVLLPGDAEAEALHRLDLGHCDVVELPHHGSAGGYDDDLLHTLGPCLSVVSVGPNRFGHPTAAMLDLMAAHGVPLLRTDRCGDVTISAAPSGVLIDTTSGQAVAARAPPVAGRTGS